MKGIGLPTQSFPFTVRFGLALACFAQAAMLVFVLATSFPAEIHIQYGTYIAATILTTALMEQALLRRAAGPSREDRRKLRMALERLKEVTGLGDELRLVWTLKPGELSAEVKGNTIYIYDYDYEGALESLVEEFVEYLVAEASRPYIKVLNALLTAINMEAYGVRDKIAKALSKILLKHVHENNA